MLMKLKNNLGRDKNERSIWNLWRGNLRCSGSLPWSYV